MKRRLEDTAWIVGGSAVTALGTLFGVRILTQFLTPDEYGVVSLALGISTLAISLVVTPVAQGALHYYPSNTGAVPELLGSLRRCFLRSLPWVVLVATVGGALYVSRGGSPWVPVLLVILLGADFWRSANVSLLNAARRHRLYALWMSTDTWGRPLCAAVAVVLFGHGPAVILTAHLVIAVVLVAVFSRHLWPAQGVAQAQGRELGSRLWAYAIPLIPMGIIGWASNLGDRYLIGGLLSVADAGLYAAVYGLSSAPFMLVNGTVELALRPVHQAAVAAGDHRRAARVFRLWLAAVAVPCGLGVLILAVAHPLVAALLVGKSFRSGSALMPWIGAGYALRATSYVFERICYAYGETRKVLSIQLYAAVATVIATPVGVVTWGLKGAAIAVPIYFSIQLLAAIRLARAIVRRATTPAPAPPVQHATALSG